MRTLLIIFFLGFAISLAGQDIHMTQWWNAPMVYNPAMNGDQQGEIQINTGMRSQWKGVSGVPYQTQWLQSELNKWSSHLWSFAGGVGRDIAGDGNWRQLHLFVNSSRHWVLDSANTVISIGGQVQFQQWAWDSNNWQWGSQWNGAYFDGQLPSLEDQMQQRVGIFSIHSGSKWIQNWSPNLQSKLGMGIHQLYASSFDVNGTQQRLMQRWTASIQLNYALSLNWKFAGMTLYQKQAAQTEWTNLVHLENVLDDRPWNYLSWKAGFGFRNRDALILFLGGRYGQHQLGLSYDWNVSKFSEATEYRGGWELHYSWLLNPLPVPKRVKPACPDYY